jgi:DNA adenine methylase
MTVKNLKTPLRYPGGKSRATKFLFDKDNLPIADIKEYREMFLGGGSCALYFSILRPEVPVWVNDKYYNLYCFWTELQKDGKKLADKIHSVKKTLEESGDSLQSHLDYYRVMREGLNTAEDPFEIAWMFYVMNRCSFSGLGETTGSFSKIAVFDLFNHNLIAKLPKFSHLTRNWKITNLDYSELLVDADKDTFIFADPPYDIKSFIYGNEGDMHNSFCHKRFHDQMDSTDAKVMITYNSNEELRKAYNGWKQIEWDLTYTMVSTKRYREEEHLKKELLLLNYDTRSPSTIESFFEQ